MSSTKEKRQTSYNFSIALGVLCCPLGMTLKRIIPFSLRKSGTHNFFSCRHFFKFHIFGNAVLAPLYRLNLGFKFQILDKLFHPVTVHDTVMTSS